MIKAIEFLLEGTTHRIEFVRNIDDPDHPRLKLVLICPLCGVRGEMAKDMFTGKVSMRCENKLDEGMGLKVGENNELEKQMPEPQGDHKVCQYHQTHNFLDMAQKQIEAIGNWVNS